MQHRGHILILRPDLDQKNFEALDHFQKHKADYKKLREKFTFINPKIIEGQDEPILTEIHFILTMEF